MTTKTLIEYEIRSISPEGDSHGAVFFDSGRGSKRRMQKIMEKIKGNPQDYLDEDNAAYIFERVIAVYSVVGDGYEDELEDKDYETIDIYGDEFSLKSGEWI